MMHSVVPSQQQQQQQQSHENGLGKTPARSATRRALGDISNRKVSIAASFNDNIGSKTPLVKKGATTTTSIYKETSKSVVPKEVNPEVLRNTINNNQQLQLPNHQPSLRVTTTATTTNRNKSNNVTFILPDDTKNHLARIPPILPAPQRRITTLNHINSKHHSTLWNYDDESEIELPAGRLYHQQLLMYDDDDDDNNSQLSLEGAKTFREDFMKVVLEEHNEAMQEKEKYIQYCIEQLEQNCIITDDDTFINDDHDSFDTTDEDDCCLTITLIVDDHTNSTADVEWHSTYIDFPPPL